MILTDYFRSPRDLTWDYARQCGVEHGTIRLPETKEFDITDKSHWADVHKNFMDFGIKPVVVEPLPNELHDHIKAGDAMRDASIEKCIHMIELMDEFDIRTLCFNFMAHIGWLRTRSDLPERGGAKVTGFTLEEFTPVEAAITEKELWDNYAYFIKAVLPHAEKHNIRLALHPDDPPLPRLGDVSRIMISYDNIRRAVREIADSPSLGVTFCQACYAMMGEDVFKIVPEFADKIFFIHFRNAVGCKTAFRETFHDNGCLPMARLMKLYCDCGLNVPIRVDHVPTMAGETSVHAGYDAIGRLYAIGYLKGILESCEVNG